MKIVLLFISIFAQTILSGFTFRSIEASYVVKYGILGTVGEAEAKIKIDEGTYKIKITAHGVGVSDLLSRGRVESYESTGLVVDGHLLPTLFVKERSWGEKVEKKRYFFDHDRGEIRVIKSKRVGDETSESSERLGYYSNNDILTLFFNLPFLLGKDLHALPERQLVAVGAKRDTGLVSVKTPMGKEKKEIEELLERKDPLLVVTLHQKLFSSKEGKIFMHISKEGVSDRIVLKDLFLYGDLYGELRYLRVDEKEIK